MAFVINAIYLLIGLKTNDGVGFFWEFSSDLTFISLGMFGEWVGIPCEIGGLGEGVSHHSELNRETQTNLRGSPLSWDFQLIFSTDIKWF